LQNFSQAGQPSEGAVGARSRATVGPRAWVLARKRAPTAQGVREVPNSDKLRND
jgi:hypothetical protein